MFLFFKFRRYREICNVFLAVDKMNWANGPGAVKCNEVR